MELVVEDDGSEMKDTVTTCKKLLAVDRVQGLLTGSWWVNAVVKQVERRGIPFLSAETTYDQDSVLAPNYFIMLGDLKDWVAFTNRW